VRCREDRRAVFVPADRRIAICGVLSSRLPSIERATRARRLTVIMRRKAAILAGVRQGHCDAVGDISSWQYSRLIHSNSDSKDAS